ncbi:MAG: 4Fe-4S dicluster domain-containing protein, partial [Lentisphaerales bacterium]
MIIAVASGKGGTGKTTFAVNLAYTLARWNQPVRLLDCDVEEPNDHLFVKPAFTEEKMVTALKPVLNSAKCNGCGKCVEVCKSNALALVKGKLLIFSELCHSCGACSYVCPERALTELETPIGIVKIAAENKPFFFAHGLLNIGEALAPKVVGMVKECIDSDAINILDASPGTACPVVKAIDGVDVVVLVTEPTPFGLHDLKLAAGLSLQMKIPTGILVNRSDGKDTIIADYARSAGIPIVGRIPFKRAYAKTYSSGGVLVEHHEELKTNLLCIYDNICKLQGSRVPEVPDVPIVSVAVEKSSTFSVGSADSHKEVTVISGKGGTGKTTVVASFAVLSENKVLADNDVDASDLHLLLAPSVRELGEFVGGEKSSIDPAKCCSCGKCAEGCHFSAIHLDGPANDLVGKTYMVDRLSCEGCGLCSLICPVGAITTEPNVTGHWYVSDTAYGPMSHACLGIAEENSGKLVSQVRSKAGALARDLRMGLILGDGSPGTGCPVIASISGTDLVVIVTEPTVSGVHDMERVF